MLYYATNGEGWDKGEGAWLASSNECDWYGVTCSNSMVTNLWLFSNNLSGTIPSEIGVLTNLCKFDLFSCLIGLHLVTEQLELLMNMSSTSHHNHMLSIYPLYS